jgi:nucleoside-diphosphate-sugar epimerase
MKEVETRENIIVGTGMLAKSFRNIPDANVLIFASGVSNSSEKRRSEFDREIKFLIKSYEKYPEKKLLYFSSYAAKSGNTPYAKHKAYIENLIREISSEFLIFRLPQVVGFSNNNTLFNYLIKSIFRNEKIVINKNSYRSLLDVCDLVRIVCLVIGLEIKNEVVPIGPASPKSIMEILWCIETVVGLKANSQFVDAGDYQSEEMEKLVNLIGDNDPVLRKEYQDEVIIKYSEEFMRRNQGD